MEKTLNAIQVLNKIGKVLSKIAFICGIVGAVGCLLGIVSLAMGMTDALKIGGVTIHGLVANETGMSTNEMIFAMTEGMIACIAETVLAGFAGSYFKNELNAGTPFTIDGSKEMMRLGILCIALPIGASIISAIVNGIMSAFMSGTWDESWNNDGDVSLGIMFIVMSVILKYGAEVEAEHKKTSQS